MTTPKPPWLDDLEADEADPYTQVIVDFIVLAMVLVLSLICAGIVYQVAHPFINEVIATWSFVP